MKRICSCLVVMIYAFVNVIVAGCQVNTEEEYALKQSYYYTILTSIHGGIDGTDSEFELRPKRWRREKFRHSLETPKTAMYAYRLLSRKKYSYKPDKSGVYLIDKTEVVFGDTIEVAVTKAQADTLFLLAKRVFESLTISNVDTVCKEPKITTFHFDDAHGRLMLNTNYAHVQIEIGPLHSSDSRQAPAFLVLCN